MGMRNLLGNLQLNFSSNRRVLGSVAALFTGNFTAAVLGALGSLLAARFIGPAETGLFRSFTIPIMYLTFLHLGTFDGLSRQIPYYIGKGMQRESERLALAGGAWNLTISSIVTGWFLFLAAQALVHRQYDRSLGWFSQAVFCWSVYYGGYLSATYRSVHRFVSVARIQTLQMSVSFLLVFLLPWLQFPGLCLRYATPAALAVWLYHRSRPFNKAYRIDIFALKDLVRVGLPFCFWGSLETSLWVATESALLLYLAGESTLGLFAVAVAVREGLSVLPLAIHQVLIPRLVESLARHNSMRRIAAKTMLATAAATASSV